MAHLFFTHTHKHKLTNSHCPMPLLLAPSTSVLTNIVIIQGLYCSRPTAGLDSTEACHSSKTCHSSHATNSSISYYILYKACSDILYKAYCHIFHKASSALGSKSTTGPSTSCLPLQLLASGVPHSSHVPAEGATLPSSPWNFASSFFFGVSWLHSFLLYSLLHLFYRNFES